MAKFTVGKSGNPKGRPKGVADQRVAYRELLQPHAPELVAKAVELALAGDTTALRLCLERLIPATKPKDEPVAFPLAEAATLSESGQAVLLATAQGTLTPQQAQQLLSALASQAKLIETDELTRRVAALEDRQHATD